jgi:hypothetical protein
VRGHARHRQPVAGLLAELQVAAAARGRNRVERAAIEGGPLAERLNDRTLRQLKQRVALRAELRPLTAHQTAEYLAGRISAAGGLAAQVFTRQAVVAICDRSRGIPRTISVIADNALLSAFALQLRMKGRGAVNDLQLKLVDASGDNVWWVNRPSFPLPRSLTNVTFQSRHFSFAWGPTADRTLARTASLELVVAAGQGGKGALCVSRLRVEEREVPPAVWPEPLVREQAGMLELDYRRTRELNGLTLEWPGRARPTSYDVLASDDEWNLVHVEELDAAYGQPADTREVLAEVVDGAAFGNDCFDDFS